MVGDIDGLDDIWSRYVATLNCPHCDSDGMLIRWASMCQPGQAIRHYWRFTCQDCNGIWYDPRKGPAKTYLPKRQ